MRKLLENGCHYGHQTRRWNPKMKPYIYTAKNGIYILNLSITLEKLDEAYAAMKDIAERGGKVLFVGTKKQAQQAVLDEALRCGSFYVNQRWLGGLLTNYRTIQKRIRRLIEIGEMKESGAIEFYTKKEIAQINKEETRLENFLGGIREMKKLPDAIFVVDPIEDHNAVFEAKKLGIPVFGICDTNTDPDHLDYLIPANDDALRSIKLITGILADAIVESKAGILNYVYQSEEEADITMKDVIVSVEQQIEENERRRRQRNEERRAKENARYNRRPYQRSEQTRRSDNAPRTSEAAPAAKPAEPANEVKKVIVDKTGEVKEVVATKESEVKEAVVKTEAAVADKAEAVKEAVVEKAAEVKDTVVEKAAEAKEAVADKAAEVKEAVSEKAAEVKEAVSEKAVEAKDSVKKAEAAVEEKAEEVKKAVSKKAEEVKEAVSEKAAEVKDAGEAAVKQAEEKVKEVVTEAVEKAAEVAAKIEQ
jgi:small subunit ribosomal protein S2